MQKNILIIGNGFDIYHKLPTKYTDFIFLANHWKEFKTEYDKNRVAENSINEEPYVVRLGKWSELTAESLTDFAKHADSFPVDHIDYLDEHIPENIWLKLFSEIKLTGQTWIDFEHEIERVLTQVEKYYHEVLPTVENTYPGMSMPETMRNIVYSFSKKVGEGYKNYAAVKNFNAEDMDQEEVHLNKILLLKAMQRELDVLNMCLNYYLQDFVSSIKIQVYCDQIRDLTDTYLLNFNYTYTYAAVYGKQRSLLEHHAIHGEVKEENMVMGIPDESFPESIDYVYFQKYFQRIQKKTGNFYKKWLEKPASTAAEDDSIHVYVMGHSLNKVDKGILKEFFINDYVKRITIFYHSQTGYENLVINLVEMFGRDFVIENTGNNRIVFEELHKATEGAVRG